MLSEQEIIEAIGAIEKDMTGFIAASLVDLDSGMTLGVKTKDPNFDLTTASAFNSELVKQKLKIMSAIGMNGELEEMLMTLSNQVHCIRLVSPSTFFYLAADRGTSNHAIVRSAIGKHVHDLDT